MRIEARTKTYDFSKFVPKQNKKTTCSYFRKVRLDEVLEEIKNYCDLDEASDENEERMNVIVSTKQIAVYISPPDNGGTTDEDSGDEDTVTLANCPGNQITAAAEIKDSAPTSQTSHDRGFQSQTVKSRKARHWQKKDLPKTGISTEHATYKPTLADLPRSPAETFELFVDEVVRHLTAQTISYAAQSENHQFSMSCDEIRIFIKILLLSGYCSVLRRKLYWSNEPDSHSVI